MYSFKFLPLFQHANLFSLSFFHLYIFQLLPCIFGLLFMHLPVTFTRLCFTLNSDPSHIPTKKILFSSPPRFFSLEYHLGIPWNFQGCPCFLHRKLPWLGSKHGRLLQPRCFGSREGRKRDGWKGIWVWSWKWCVF